MRWLLSITLGALVGWRVVWLLSGVPDVTAQADQVRLEAFKAMANDVTANDASVEAYLVAFLNDWDDTSPTGLHLIREEIWDPELPIWITPGRDDEPGWAGWDDNRNGEVDEAGELGAAWSDDFCVVGMSEEPAQPAGRIIDRGAFRKTQNGEKTGRLRFTWK